MQRLKLLGGASIETAAGPMTGKAVQRRRIALLALLAARRSAGLSRDKLVALLWPTSDAERARALLSDSVYRVNQGFATEVIQSVGDELRLNPSALPSDVAEFDDAVASADHERVVSLYIGPFLDGFFLSESPEFERWADGERSRRANEYATSLESLAKRAAERGDRSRAVMWWRRLAAHDPYNSRVALELMEALDAAGERAAAIQHARVHSTLLRGELDVEPDAAVTALADRLRSAPEPARPRADPPVPPVTPAPPAPAIQHTPEPVPAASTSVPAHIAAPRRGPRLFALGAAAAAILVVVVVLFARRGPDTAATPPTPASSIAVLPFANLSTDRENEYFADGITEELIATLARIEGLKVPSRTSVLAYKGRGVDIRQVATELGVATVLEGSVRKDRETLRITAQLIDAKSGYHIWSEHYERELRDVFSIQKDIASSIATALRMQREVALVEEHTSDPVGYDLYLKGRFFWHERSEAGLRRAVDYLTQAVQRMPHHARAWVALGDAWAVLAFYDYVAPREGYPKAEEAARRAIALDSMLAAPNATLAYVNLYYHWNWERSEEQFRRAIRLDPGYSTAHQWYGNFLTAMGRFGEAKAAMRRAKETDPLSLIAAAALGWTFWYAGQADSATRELRQVLELSPDYLLGHLWLGQALEELGRPGDALVELRRAAEISKRSSISLAALAHAFASSGARDSARMVLTEIEGKGSREYVPSFEVAKVHLALGDRATALAWLERAFRERSHSMAFLKVDPQLRALEGDPQFADLKRRVGLD